MVTKTTNQNQIKISQTILKELQVIKNQLGKLLLLIPEESLKEYRNIKKIEEAYFRALKTFPPQ